MAPDKNEGTKTMQNNIKEAEAIDRLITASKKVKKHSQAVVVATDPAAVINALKTTTSARQAEQTAKLAK